MSTVVDANMVPVSEAGRRLGLSRVAVLKLIARGALPCVLTPLGRLISADAVEQLRQERLENPPQRFGGLRGRKRPCER